MQKSYETYDIGPVQMGEETEPISVWMIGVGQKHSRELLTSFMRFF